MEIPNAFIGKTSAPTVDEVVAALGPTSEVWKQLIDWVAEQGATVQEWNSYSAKSGWAMRLKVKKRNIVYLAPCSVASGWHLPLATGQWLLRGRATYQRVPSNCSTKLQNTQRGLGCG